MISNPNFSTITKERVLSVADHSSMMPWVQFFVTGECNKKCKYCKRFGATVDPIPLGYIAKQCRELNRKINKIKLTGGEPTTHPKILQLIQEASCYANDVSLGTNGEADTRIYSSMASSGLTSSTVSFDKYSDKSKSGIQALVNSGVRVVAGITLSSKNKSFLQKTIDTALNLGCSDCTVSISTHEKNNFAHSELSNINTYGRPILSFRIKNAVRNETRGGHKGTCYLCKDSCVFYEQKRYPCQIYLREGGASGLEPKDMSICSKFCPDFAVEFNKECQKIHE